MIESPSELPAGAVLGQARTDLRAALAGSSAIWLEGLPDRFRDAAGAKAEPGAVIATWQASQGGTVDGSLYAEAAVPNEGNGLVQAVGEHGAGLRCIPETNCGLILQSAMENAGHGSLAVIYHPDPGGESRTLLTLNTGYHGRDAKRANYLFLSESGGYLTVKDTKGAIGMTVPVAQGDTDPQTPRLILMTLSKDRLAIAQELGPVETVTGADPGMHRRADLFIGCRSNRRGLKKTLGGALIRDVLIWPDHRLLLPKTEADRAMHRAIQRYFLWEY